MAVRKVEIRRDAEGQYSFDPPAPVTLGPGDWVWWQFKDIPAGRALFIQFQAPSPQFGPFHSVRSLGNDSVIGKGNTGHAGPYSYRVLLLNPKTGEPEFSQYQEDGIDNQGQVDTSPVAFVQYTAHSADPIRVTPDSLRLNAGDTATWVIRGLEEGMFVTFNFTNAADTADDTASANRTGPFSSFFAMADGGSSEERVVRAHATGFMTGAGSDTPPDPIPAQFRYWIHVWNSDGTPAGKHDPVIDNLGPPIPG